jgi:hypothetical protein
VSDQESALVMLAAVLDENRIPYMVIGGLANAVWGEPRATLDIDVTVWVDESAIAAVAKKLSVVFRVLAEDPIGFVHENRVLPLESGRGVRVDLIFGLLPFERDAVRRAVVRMVAGAPVRFCTAEDLILMKIISNREQDLTDAAGVTVRRMAELDLAYIEPRVRELADLLGNPEITRRWLAWKATAADRR